jgi:hypothetical protein
MHRSVRRKEFLTIDAVRLEAGAKMNGHAYAAE